jgi:hypothetical protein
MTNLFEPKNWTELEEKKELPLWGEVVSTVLQVYASFKFAVAAYVPLVVPGSRDELDLKVWRDSYDRVMLAYLDFIKPAARNRGIIFHIGNVKDIFFRDAVISQKDWTKVPGTSAHAIAASYRAGSETSANPLLSIFHLGGDQKQEGWFSKKTRVYDLPGSWPLSKLKWNQQRLPEAYDIWAIPGNSPGEIDIFEALGDSIGSWTDVGAQQYRHNSNHPVFSGFKALSVRAVRPKTLPSEDPKVLKDIQDPRDPNVKKDRLRAVYELCEDSKDAQRPFKIWAFFWPEPIVQGKILLPDLHHEWRNSLLGIAVDSVRLWVFTRTFIASVSHTNVKQHMDSKAEMPDWTPYYIPKEVAGYVPSADKGLLDLSACDDGTLTAVIQDENGLGRIFTATPRFEGDKVINMIIERKVTDDRGNVTTSHGWVRESGDKTVALRVHKLPIFCWRSIERLEDELKQADAEALLPAAN